MVKLIQQCGYFKSGSSADGYMKYIATREGVEIIPGSGEPTTAQKNLIENILRDFPDSVKLFEYDDYRQSPSRGSASAFISAALDYNAHSVKDRDIYMKYIATRPRAEKHGEHGLFSAAETTDLDTALWFLKQHRGNVWTIIYSLRREDASRLGYDNADSWRKLLCACQTDMAEAMKIYPANFRWYAAYHDEGYHPHIHMMIWSDDPKQGYLNKAGVEAMRSKLTNEIFRDEMYSLYTQKDISYKELRDTAQASMRKLIRQMEKSVCVSPVIEQKMFQLVAELEKTTGKKQYGYLKKPVKEIVDSIVDELAKQPEVAQCYEEWNRLRDELESYYKDKPREHLPLSQQKEFRAIKNMIIREAENIRQGVPTFEDEGARDEPEIPKEAQPEYHSMWDIVFGTAEPHKGNPQVEHLENLWRSGWTAAAFHLGQLYRDGKEVDRDLEKAEQWFTQAAQAGDRSAEYALGKLLLEQGRCEDGLVYLTRAADHGNTWVMYRLGKELLTGEHFPRDPDLAARYFAWAGRYGNSTAQYALGKLLLDGKDIPRDKETALRWLELSAAQGNPYAQTLIDRADESYGSAIILSASRMLHHMGRIFRANTAAPANPQGIRADSHRKKYIQQKRLAMGHKIDDHEDYVPTQNWEQTM